jgi:hypothetical protein
LKIQEAIGRKTMDRSLRTKDPRQAKRLLVPVLQEWHQAFDDARRAKAIKEGHSQTITSAQMAAREYNARVTFDGEIRAADHRYAALEIDADLAREFRKGFAGGLSDDELEQLVGDRMERYRAAGFHDDPKRSPAWRKRA